MPAANEVSLKITVDDQGSDEIADVVRMFRNLDKATKDTAKSFQSIDRTTDMLTDAFRDVGKAAGTWRDQNGRLRDSLGRFTKEVRGAEGSMLDYATALSGVAQGLSRVRDFGARQLTGFIQSASRLEDITSGFTSILGSADKAEAAISRLRTAAQDPGLDFETAARATRRFAAFNVELDDAIKITRGFANAAAVSGASTAELDEGLRQLAKAIGNNKLEADDLSSILERFGPIGQRLREEFGKTGEEITKNLRASGRSVKDLAVELADLAKQPVADANTLRNAISNLRNEFGEFSQNIGNVLLPAVKRVVDALTELLKWFNDLPEPIQTAIAVAGTLATGLAALGTAAVATAAGITTLTVAFGAVGGGGLIAAVGSATAGISAFAAAIAPIAVPVGLAATAVVALATAYHQLNNTLEAQVARQGGLGKIASVTVKADEATKNFTATINLNADAFQGVVDGAKNATDAVIDYGKAVEEAAAQVPKPQLSGINFRDVARPTIAPPRSPQRLQRDPNTAPLGTSFTPAGPQPRYGQAVFDQIRQSSALQKRAAETVANFNEKAAQETTEAWEKAYGTIGTLEDRNVQKFLRNSQRTLRTRQVNANHARNLTKLQVKDSVDASTRQLKALGDLSRLTFDYQDDATSGFRDLTDKTRLYRTALGETGNAFGRLALAFSSFGDTSNESLNRTLDTLSKISVTAVEVANILGAVSSIADRASGGGGGGGQGGAGGAINTIKTIANVAGIIASIVKIVSLFHDPANDRLAELAGLRVGGNIPTGQLRAIRRQNARDFSDSFARGVERQSRQLGRQGSDIPIEVHIPINVSDKTTQEIVKRVNVMSQSGRTYLRG